MTIRERVTIQPGGVVEVRNPGLPAGAEVEVVIQLESQEAQVSPSVSSRNERRPIWEIIEEIGARVPPGEWEKIPSDLSQNLDHYL